MIPVASGAAKGHAAAGVVPGTAASPGSVWDMYRGDRQVVRHEQAG
jgi:hypothetical protein